MKNRLIQLTKRAQKEKTKLFCAFLTLGYPNLKTTEALIRGFEEQGVDILELGFPFSDPMADGPTIQFSSEHALRKGVGLEDAFKVVARLRKKGVKLPIIFFSYFNPIFHYGMDRFLKKAKKAGFDAMIIPDLPPDEEKKFQQKANRSGLALTFLIAPTTGRVRAARIAHKSQGFVYYVSLRGVTGARRSLPGEVRAHLKQLRRSIKKPVLIGFGVSTPAQARSLSGMGQGVIVGSALIDRIRRSGGAKGPVLRYVRSMVKAVKGKVNGSISRS